MFFFKQKTAYEITRWLEFRRVLFRSRRDENVQPPNVAVRGHVENAQVLLARGEQSGDVNGRAFNVLVGSRSEERRVGKESGAGGPTWRERADRRSAGNGRDQWGRATQ